MKNIVKSLVAMGITSALAVSAVHAASYEVIDRGEVSSLKYTYAQQENNNGESVLSGTENYNIPVLFQYLDEDDYDAIVSLAERSHEIVLDLNDIEDETSLREGDPNANDFAWVIRYLKSISSFNYQKINDTVVLLNQGGDSQEITIFDVPFDNTSTLTRSTTDFVNGITDNGWVYGNGSAPYLPVDFTNSDDEDVTFWLRDFNTRAFITNDQGATIKTITAPDTSFYNGESAILDIEGFTAVGYASVATNVNVVESIEETDGGCADQDILDDTPYDACVQSFVSATDFYHLNAYVWTLDENANVVEGNSLGLLVTPNSEDERVYRSYAQAVNEDGVVVGFSHGWIDETETEPSQNEARSLYAVVYKDGEVISFTEDHAEHFDSRAYDINNSGIAVGHVNTFINGNLRTKFYYVDTSVPADEMQMVFPNDYFEGSSSTARAINESGFIVGEGEIETQSGSTTRRTNGFLYDLHNDNFTNINDLTECNSPYSIIEARDINDNNEISATAIVKAPRRDAKGELMYDDEGNQLTEDVVRAVTLVPTGGEVEDCSQVEDVIERQGAGFGFGLLGLMLTFGLRRWVK
ncbi:MAG: DUF3466 family protein [Thalassotalea sp.]|nr:DUF3466 family protein [Thalassotalea sp.]